MNALAVLFAAVFFLIPKLNAGDQASFEVPRLTSPVMDQAGVMSPEGRDRVERLVRSLYDSGGSQISVLTVATLGGLTIEEAGIKVVDQWKLGHQDKDDGILLLVAPNERRVRIEVGRGKEGDLPDAWARRIISQVITPAFKQGQFDEGIVLGVAAIIQRTDPQFDLDQAGAPRPRVRARSGGGQSLLHIVLFLFFVIWILLRPARRFGMYGGRGYSSWGGGGFGGSGGSSGGGGWSGGGGGFSGGGSSGSW